MGKPDFDRIFHPKGVAVVGASNDVSKFGNIFYSGLREFGCKVYPVNPKEKEILGIKAYPSVDKIPYEVDYAVISIPARNIPKVIEDCGKKGVKAVSIYAASYGENGTEEGKEREKELAETSKKAKVRIIGPNCLGIYCPSGKLSFFPGMPLEPGDVAFLSQSGGHAEEFAYKAEGWGIKFSKIVSFGNACDVTCEELLEYLGEDPETRIIGIYIEGTKNGRRFFDVLREVAKKTVVIWKGGKTEAGAQAVASHTGSLAGSVTVWEVAITQAGAIGVDDFEELADTICAFEYLPIPRGRKVAILGAGGGASVASADTCEKNGLTVATLEEETMEKLGKIVSPLGTSVKNPVDLSYFVLFNFPTMKDCVETISSDPNVDILIAHVSHLDMMLKALPTVGDIISETLFEAREMMEKFFPEKPMAIVLPTSASFDLEVQKVRLREKLVKEGFCVYPSITRAVRAMENLASFKLGARSPTG